MHNAYKFFVFYAKQKIDLHVKSMHVKYMLSLRGWERNSLTDRI